MDDRSNSRLKNRLQEKTCVDQVLQNYLDQLLSNALEAVPVEKEGADAPLACERLPSLNSDLKEQVTERAIAQAVDNEVEPEIFQTAPENWSSQGVECLVFTVAGLKLAVPLLFLGGVHEVSEDELTPLFAQPDWHLGLLASDQGQLQVIDTAVFIMPERSLSLRQQGFKYLIQLDKSAWVIACQSIDGTVRLDANAIKWRGDRGKRPWLAGTVIKEMCALLDVTGLLTLVEDSTAVLKKSYK